MGDSSVGGGTLYTERVLVVNQKAKVIGLNTQYTVFDQHGRQVGAVREIGQNRMKNAVAVRPIEHRTRKYQVLDHHGRLVMSLVRPSNFIKSKVIVRAANGAEIGQIAQKTVGVIRDVRFDLESGGRVIGSISGEGWSVWDFSVRDQTGSEVARITRTWAGRLFMEASRHRDKYVVEMYAAMEEPLRSLVLGTALAIDVALRS